MSSIRMLIAAVVLSALLVACGGTITITPFVPPDVDFVIGAQAFVPEAQQPDALRTITVPARDEVWVRVTFGSSDADHRFVEIVPTDSSSGLQLETWGQRGRRAELVSRSPLLFGTATAMRAATSTVESQAERSSLSSPWKCFGPCVAERYQSGDVYVRIANAASSSRTVRFYAYGIEAWDTSSSTPSDPTTIHVTAPDTGVSGAIETVDDVDYFVFTCPSTGPWFGEVYLELERSVDAYLGQFELVTVVGTYGVGEVSDLVPCGSSVLVRSPNGTAGPSDASRYVIYAN